MTIGVACKFAIMGSITEKNFGVPFRANGILAAVEIVISPMPERGCSAGPIMGGHPCPQKQRKKS